MYIPLTIHSAYSLQESLAMPAELVQAALADGLPALGLADHRLLTGSIGFVQACHKGGIQPLLGLEIDLESGSLALLAMSLSGWSSLCTLSSALALRSDTASACPFDLLASNSRDLITITSDQGDPTGQRVSPLKDIFPDCLYLDVRVADGDGFTISEANTENANW